MLDRQRIHGWNGLQAVRADWLLHRGVGRSLWAVVVHGRLLLLLAKLRASQDAVAECVQGDASLGVDIKDALQDPVQAGRDGQNGLKKARVPQEGTEGGVIRAGALPWVAATDQVDQNHAQAPDVIRC